MKKLAMKMLSLLLVLSLLLPTCVFAQPGQDGDGTPGTQGAAMEDADAPTGGGSDDEDTDAPTGGGNSDEDADAPTGGGNGDGDADVPTGGGNSDENADVSEEEAAPTVVEMEEVVLDLSDMDLPDNDELFAAYVEREFDRAAGGMQFPVFYSSSHATHDLSPAERLVYNELKNEIEKIAEGTRTNTIITTTNPFCYTWTASDLSVSGSLWSGSTLTAEAQAAAKAKASEQVSKMWDRLLADCPYELYWCDKRSVPFGLSYSDNGGNLKVEIKPIKFTVAKEYAASGAADTFVTNGKPSLVTTAVKNAQNILDTYNASSTTYTTKQKMEGYKNKICEWVSYNDGAAAPSYTDYGNPWQMIWVFDGDNSTKVVCEGYAKAFQYLCEKSTPQIKCYNVTGTMGGNHMWNVVEVGNARYLVDVTNCDEGTTGEPDKLFLKAVNSADGGKTHVVNGSTYTYDSRMDGLFCAGYPTLRELQSIAITMPPSKTTYAQGENFDPAGMVVKAHYSDGNDIVVTDYTVEGGNNLAAGSVNVTIKYAELDNEKMATQAVTVTDKPELKGSVTIDKTSPKIGDTLTADTTSLSYNGATAGTLSYQWKAGGDNVGSNSDKYTVQVGDHNKKITVTVTNSNNTGSVSSMATAAVVKKDGPSAPTGTITVKNVTAEGFTYEAKMGQQYAISTNSVSPADSEWEVVVTASGDKVVTGKNANTEYYIYTRVAETDEAYASAASTGTPVKTLMSALPSHFYCATHEAVYTGSANGATVTSAVHSSSSDFTLKYNGDSTAPTNVGKYTLTAEVKAHGSFAATTVELGTWEIKPLEVTLTWNNIADRTYDGNNSNVTATVSNKKGTDDVSVTVTGGTEANAGSHTATADALTGTAAGNYKLPSPKPTQTYTINAATITVGTDAFKDYTGVYDGNPHSIKVNTSKITTANHQPITIKYGTTVGTYDLDAAPTATNVSDSKTVYYKITAPNHEAKTGTATITINKATQTITGDGFSVKVGKTVNLNDKFSAQGSLTYSITGANTTGSSVSSGVLTVGATTGSFTLKVDAVTTDNYEAANKTVTVTVTAKEVQTITAGNVSATYGDTNVKVVGSTNGDGAITYAVTAGTDVVDVDSSTGALTIKKAGTATVTISAAETSDYATTTKNVTINVAQKDVTITGLGAANKVYDGNDTATITGTAVVAGKVGSDDVTVNVTGGTATFDNKNVGAGKTVTFSGYGLSGTAAGNYKLTAQPASVTAEITAREVTITNGITATNRPYEKNNTTVNLNKSTLTFTNLVTGETLDANVPTTGTVDNANVGTGKNVTYSGVTLIDGTGMASNYKLVGLPTVTVDIAQATTPAAPTGLNGVKGNALSTVTLPDGWTWVNGSTVMNTVGLQTFKANYTDAAGNYANATGVNVMVDVKDKTDVSGKISFNDGTLVYTGAGQKYETASISGITAGTGVTWTYGYTAGTGTLDGGLPKTVGTYTVAVTYEDSLNYGTKFVTLTITQATPTGAPKFTKITSSGKTLGDAALVKTVSGPGDGFSVAGTVEWVDGSGAPLADSTSVEANKSYGWRFTPTDSNYKSISGSVVVYTVRRVSHSGGAAADSAAAAAAQPTVYSGSRGESVKTLQAQLNAKGFNVGSVDGIFGKNTRAAVMAFQKANGLAADGIVGKLTWAKLYDTTAALPAASTATGTQPMVYRGSRGDAVRKLQELLNKKGFDCGAVDGIFGSKTYAAVVTFQKANGLGADGIVGPLTWGKLG